MKTWLLRLARFLAGNALLQLVNFLSAIVLLRVLPLEEYASYTVATSLILVVSPLANMGISQAMISIGARHGHDAGFLGALDSTALWLSRRLSVLAIVASAAALLAMSFGAGRPLTWVLAEFVLIVCSGWIQNRITMQQAMLNIQHDDLGMLLAGMSGNMLRLLLTAFCLVFPSAEMALLGILAGLLVTSVLLQRRSARYVSPGSAMSSDLRRSILRFIQPLALVVVYFALQNQISVLILGFQGHTASVAQIGALGRLAQIIGLLIMLNPFFVQPLFARTETRQLFLWRLGVLGLLLAAFSFGTILSSIYFPAPWLWILGANYSGLTEELPIAVACAVVTLIGGTLYTVVIARGDTSHQYWGMVVGLASQLAVVGLVGVQTTAEALYFNLMPAVGYAVVQMLILFRVVDRWKVGPCA